MVANTMALLQVLDGLPLAWRLYVVVTLGVTVLVILLNVWFVFPPLVRDSWEWIHDALRKPDVDRTNCDRARMKLVVSISDRRQGES